MKRHLRKFIILITIFVVAFSLTMMYLLDNYKALSQNYSSELIVEIDHDETIVIKAKDESIHQSVGIGFYPGGKVDEAAYIELLAPLALNGYQIFIVAMPFDLAVFNINAMKSIQEDYPMSKWYVGGHSLGGSMIADYASNHIDEIEGIFLLASYSTSDLTDFQGSLLSVYGSNDQILNMNNYTKYESNLPEHYQLEIINGGNHAQFGSYGPQDGDGDATIDNIEQKKTVQQLIIEMIEDSE